MVTQQNEMPKCPESKQIVYYSTPRCNLNDKPCVVESGWTCPVYDDYVELSRKIRQEGK